MGDFIQYMGTHFKLVYGQVCSFVWACVLNILKWFPYRSYVKKKILSDLKQRTKLIKVHNFSIWKWQSLSVKYQL